MTRKRIITFLLLNLIFINLFSYRVYCITNNPVQYSSEDKYKYIINSLLMPYIDKAVSDYYKNFLSETPLVDPWDINILNVEKPNDLFVFVIKIQVMPYVGPHLSVGLDQITITVEGTGDVKIDNFQHINSSYLNLPSNWQNIIKKNPN